jgi:hypothetical protein
MLRRLKGPLRQVQDTKAIEETTGDGVGDDQFQKSAVRAQFRKVGLNKEQAHPLIYFTIEAGLLDTLLLREKLTQKEEREPDLSGVVCATKIKAANIGEGLVFPFRDGGT